MYEHYCQPSVDFLKNNEWLRKFNEQLLVFCPLPGYDANRRTPLLCDRKQ